ncbi:MAG: DUF4097 family beta strand repeat-containing protein [Terriglobia bacterium]
MSNGTTYRRGSVFGALLLIAIGGLFLYANMRPGFNAWGLVARYWPLVIIFWGLGKLVDYLMLRGTPEASRATRLTGGDIVGLIFLILIGTAFSHMVGSTIWRHGPPWVIGGEEIGCVFGSEYEFSEELTQEVAPPTTLNIRNGNGDIELVAGEDNQLRLQARKRVCAASESEAEELADNIDPLLENTAEGWRFRWSSEGSASFVRADLEVVVPRTTSLRLSSRQGDIRVSGIQGSVRVEPDDGDARVEDIEGDVVVEIRRGEAYISEVTGRVELEGRGGEIQLRRIGGATTVRGEFFGPIHLASIAGPTTFNSRRTEFSAPRIDGEFTLDSDELTLRRVPGDVTLHTRNYEIEAEDIGGELRIENRNGPVVIRAAQPPTSLIQIENRRGDIVLYLPPASGFRISAATRRGEIESEFSGLEPRRRNGREYTLEGTHGNGRADIRLNTDRGNIELRRTS